MKKKFVKKTESKTTNSEQKRNRVYGIIGMVALFLVGVIFGYIINGSDHVNHSMMSENQCRNIADEIVLAAKNKQPELIEQLNKVYSENCLNREFEQQKPQPTPRIEVKKLPETTCGKIETLLKDRLYSVDVPDAYAHVENAQIYANLSERGCPENSTKYKELAKQELEIARALNDDNVDKYRDESVEMVETYKRLQMQAEAEKMIEKAKKLTNPAIDFIIQLEKIIEE